MGVSICCAKPKRIGRASPFQNSIWWTG